jgi:hypothetical protein
VHVPESERLHVLLIPASSEALGKATATGVSKTDVVNRAIQLYAFVTEQQAAGSDLLLRTPEGEVERVRLF